MSLDQFHPATQNWFREKVGVPTEPQRLGWPYIAAKQNVLIAAPTGSGKTLAAFMVCLDQLARDWMENRLEDSIHVVYVSPLKALSNDIERNLRRPLSGIAEYLSGMGHPGLPIRAAVRTGDTPSRERQAMLKRPPHVLVTTPESLYLMLTSSKPRELLRTVTTVIVDEIHALAKDKRGSHLSLTLERLAMLCSRPPVRIGLSATQKPIEDIAKFLVGVGAQSEAVDCSIVDAGHVRDLDLAIETPPSELSAVCSNEQWGEVYARLRQLIETHRSTLIFVNTRRLAERVTHHLTELLGEKGVASHHGSLSREIRHDAEQRLKSGELRAIVATASLEMGIDIGYIDLVCQIGSSRAIASFLQRVGRSGHSLGALPKGRLFPLTRDELIECMALIRCVKRRELDRIELPQAPLDILAQQIVAAVSCEECDEDMLFERFRRAWPYRDLSRPQFTEVLELLSEGFAPGTRRGAYLHRDRIHGKLRARRGARLAAITSGGAIPDTAQYRVLTDTDGTYVGSLDEDFAIESMAGDIFLLGNTSWRIRQVRSGEVIVQDAEGAPPTIPFWFGEAPGRTFELSHELSRLREELAKYPGNVPSSTPKSADHQDSAPSTSPEQDRFVTELMSECGIDKSTALQACHYVEAQAAAIGIIPTQDRIVFERFFDESGGMQLVIHSPLGSRVNRAWGLALRKRFCRSFDFELQAAATDNGIILSIGPQHSFPIESLFTMLNCQNGQHLLEQALLAAPLFQVRWRWNVTRGLAVLRSQGGKRVPPHMLRFRCEDLLAAAFPETVGCLENHHGDVNIPKHPFVRQTMHDCLHEAMDVDRWLSVLGRIQQGTLKLEARETREPSPFCYEILNANPYAFLDDAPLEERRTRAIQTRRTFSANDVRDLTQLSPEAIAQVRSEAWPIVRDAEELHDALLNLVCVDPAEAPAWTEMFEELQRARRAVTVRWKPAENGQIPAEGHRAATGEPVAVDRASVNHGERRFWIAAERWPLVRAVFPTAIPDPTPILPDDLCGEVDSNDALVALVRGRVEHSGPLTAGLLADLLGLPRSRTFAGLEALEGKGIVLRGRFTSQRRAMSSAVTDPSASSNGAGSSKDDDLEWCERRFLARIHRLTLDGLRRQIKPVEPECFVRYLTSRHRLSGKVSWRGVVGVREAIVMLQGFEAPAAAWERHLLGARVAEYSSGLLDQLFLSGEVSWGRLDPPRRDDTVSAAAMTRSLPLSIMKREDLAWLLPPALPFNESTLRGGAREVWEALQKFGALFFQDLISATGQLQAHLEESLRELAACGLVTSDSFAAVRAIIQGERSGRRSGGRPVYRGVSVPTGRWSRFPGFVQPATAEQRAQRWCELLLRRYGVVFRDLLARESTAPPWRELSPVFRKLELQGKVRGGRFVGGVSGEQFAEEEAVEALRQMRDTADDASWSVISAVDPVNLNGIITSGPKIPSLHTNFLAIKAGRCIAARVKGQVEFYETLPTIESADVHRALVRGRDLVLR